MDAVSVHFVGGLWGLIAAPIFMDTGSSLSLEIPLNMARTKTGFCDDIFGKHFTFYLFKGMSIKVSGEKRLKGGKFCY